VRRLLLVALVLAGCGGGDEPERAAEAPVTPFPTVTFGDLEPGVEYVTKNFEPNLRITLPPGKWTAVAAGPDHVEIEGESEPPIQDSGISFHHMTQVFDPERGGEIPGDAVEGPADFAAWLTAHPHLRTTEPRPVEVMGMKGVAIDAVGVRGDQRERYKDCGKLEGNACVVLFVGGIEPIVFGRESFARYLVLEQPGGGQMVIEEWADPRSAAEAEVARLHAIVEKASLLLDDGGS
jgi:hypothetical protein